MQSFSFKNGNTEMLSNLLKSTLSLLLAASINTLSQSGAKAVVPDSELYRPTALPDRVILTWNGDPSTTQAVTWRTANNGVGGLAQIGKAEHGPNVEKSAKQIVSLQETIKTDLGFEATYHRVVFEHLEPKTKYSYRVGDGVNWSEWYTFQTASDRREPFRFLYFGDVQNGIKSHWSRLFRKAILDAPDAKFSLYAGDMVNTANKDSEWGELSYGPGWVNGTIPSLPVTGNHEFEKGVLSRHWRPSYTLPENSIPGLEESSYYLDYQGVRFIVLTSTILAKEQTPWLENLLKNNPNRWTIAAFHHPILSAAQGRDNPQLRALWKPLFDKYRVDMVLQGHDHTYARSNFSAVGSSLKQTEKSGTMYVVTVCGSKMYNLNRQAWMQRAAEDTQFYQIIEVTKDRLKYEAKTATGETYDKFELKKQFGKANELIEKVPSRPELLRKPKGD